MKSYWYWRLKGEERLARMEKHLEEYHDSITDVPEWCVIFFYVLMTLILPKPKDKCKYEDWEGDIMTIDRDTIIQAAATLFCLAVAAFLTIMSWLLYHNRTRRTRAVPITPVPKSEIEWMTQALDNVLAALEQDETLEWRTQYRAAEEAGLVAEQYQTRLEMREEGWSVVSAEMTPPLRWISLFRRA